MRSITAAVNESAATENGGGGPGEIMLFGVRVVVDSMRKSVSLNNLSQYEQPHEAADVIANDDMNDPVSVDHKDVVAAGYASADDAVPNACGNRERERKRGTTQLRISDRLLSLSFFWFLVLFLLILLVYLLFNFSIYLTE